MSIIHALLSSDSSADFVVSEGLIDSNGLFVIMGNLLPKRVWPHGGDHRLMFTYYFNPTANDRNLEFDPSRNLFGQTDKQRVYQP
jgi:hypothetical protein